MIADVGEAVRGWWAWLTAFVVTPVGLVVWSVVMFVVVAVVVVVKIRRRGDA